MASVIDLIDRLVTPNGAFIASESGGHQQIQWTLAGSRARFNDPTGANVMDLYPNTLSRAGGTPTFPGVAIRAPLHVGPGTSLSGNLNTTPGFNSSIFSLAADMSDYEDTTNLGVGWANLFYMAGVADGDTYGGTLNNALYGVIFQGNFDSTDGAGTGLNFSYNGHSVQLTGSMSKIGGLLGFATKVNIFHANCNFSSLNGGPTWTEFNGMEFQALNITGLTGITRGSTIKATAAPNATTTWNALFGTSGVQINTTGQFILGGTATTKGTNYLKRGTTTTHIIMGLNAIDSYQFTPTALFPFTDNLWGIGDSTHGIIDAWFRDTSAAFRVRNIFTSSPVLSANRTLTFDVSNADRTINLEGNPTLNDWFDQSVKIAASPTFAGATFSEGGNLVIGTATGSKIGTTALQKIGKWGATPVVQSTGWAVTAGYTSDKSFDPETTTLLEVARVLGTLIDTLKTHGDLGA